MAGQVLVGTDGSESSLEAVAAAAREARLRGVDLEIVHAFIWPLVKAPTAAAPISQPTNRLREQADEIVAAAVEHARVAEPQLSAIRGEVVTGEPLTILAARSRDASLVVVGSRGLGGFTGLLIGSVAVHLAAHAHCPVLVLRGRAAAEGPVAVAVDGSGDAQAAVDEAFAHAARRATGLLAVQVWSTWTGPGREWPGDMAPLVFDVDKLREECERTLADAVAPGHARHPDVAVEERVVEGRARPVLIEASGEAQLMVVGARGLGGFTGLLLGSVSQALLQHADCPVLVVRRSPEGTEATEGTEGP
ncbi:universal stress protein [Streptomyces sp. KL116D]|uniref:universal stress protein n=1 Tax=Streptomyces sp. KL116D TaxID=3045152 RepID=UPI003558466B